MNSRITLLGGLLIAAQLWPGLRSRSPFASPPGREQFND